MNLNRNDLAVIDGLLAVSELPLEERDFIEAERAICGKTATILYTVTVACCVAVIGAYGISAHLGLSFFSGGILLVPLMGLAAASVCYFLFPKWLGSLRFRQQEIGNSQQRDIAFYHDHLEIRENGGNTESYPYPLIKQTVISENLYIIVLPDMVILPIRHAALPEEQWGTIRQHIHAVMTRKAQSAGKEQKDIPEDSLRFTRLMYTGLIIMLCGLLLVPNLNNGSADPLPEAAPEATPAPEACTPDIAVMEYRENELVFTLSLDGYIACFNEYYGRGYLTPACEWRHHVQDAAIHSGHETNVYYFTADEKVYSLPTITVYTPANGDYIQEITVNFDDHSYTESDYAQYRQMCFCTLKVFFPELSDASLMELCTEAITLGNRNLFASDEWYGSGSVPCALFYKDGIGVYPYFAIGDWARLCVIPVTEQTIANFKQKGVQVYEID